MVEATTGEKKAVRLFPSPGSCSPSGAFTTPSTGSYPEGMLQQVPWDWNCRQVTNLSGFKMKEVWVGAWEKQVGGILTFKAKASASRQAEGCAGTGRTAWIPVHIFLTLLSGHPTASAPKMFISLAGGHLFVSCFPEEASTDRLAMGNAPC